jgi:hypothetical protein
MQRTENPILCWRFAGTTTIIMGPFDSHRVGEQPWGGDQLAQEPTEFSRCSMLYDLC